MCRTMTVRTCRATRSQRVQTLRAAGSNPRLLFERHGNNAADEAAKAALTRCPLVQVHGGRLRRTHQVCKQLLLFFGRLLGWLAERALLPGYAPRPKARRIPPLPPHVVADSPCGHLRCVRCLRVTSECARTVCLPWHARPHMI